MAEANSSACAWPDGDDCSLPTAVKLVGGVADYLAIFGPGPLGWAAVAVGLVGLVTMVRNGLGGAVGVIAAAAVLAAAVARLGDVWPLAKAVNAHRAAVLVPSVAVFPTAFLLGKLLERLRLRTAVVLAADVQARILGAPKTERRNHSTSSGER